MALFAGAANSFRKKQRCIQFNNRHNKYCNKIMLIGISIGILMNNFIDFDFGNNDDGVIFDNSGTWSGNV